MVKVNYFVVLLSSYNVVRYPSGWPFHRSGIGVGEGGAGLEI